MYTTEPNDFLLLYNLLCYINIAQITRMPFIRRQITCVCNLVMFHFSQGVIFCILLVLTSPGGMEG